MFEEDEGVTHPCQGLFPSGPTRIEHPIEPDVGFEGLAAGHFEATVHEELPLGAIVEEVDTGLARVVDQGSIGEARSSGEARGVVGIGQRLGGEAELPRIARAAGEPSGCDREDHQPGQARQADPHRQAVAHRVQRLAPRSGDLGRQLSNPGSEVGGEHEAGHQGEEARRCAATGGRDS